MFWKQRPRQGDASGANLDAGEVVSQVGGIFADFSGRGQLVRPRSSLPCSWFAVRECFVVAYEREFLELTEENHNSYHYVYCDLAFFVDDDLCKQFDSALTIAAKCRCERLRKFGISEDETFCRSYLAGSEVKIQDRKEIWTALGDKFLETCPTQYLRLLAETMAHCGELHRAMRDEWESFVNFIAYRKKKNVSD